jgi:hypothetical protein
MKITLIGALLLASCSQDYSVAQNISANSLSCGTAELRLGMSESAASDVLQANGFAEISSHRLESVRSFYNNTEGHTCNVQFDKHTLVYVERYWSPQTEDASTAIETLIDAVQSVTKKTAIEHCEVFSHETTVPDHRYKYTGIKCNGHNIGVALHYDFKTKTSTFDIDEEIGMRNEERSARQRR